MATITVPPRLQGIIKIEDNEGSLRVEIKGRPAEFYFNPEPIKIEEILAFLEENASDEATVAELAATTFVAFYEANRIKAVTTFTTSPLRFCVRV